MSYSYQPIHTCVDVATIDPTYTTQDPSTSGQVYNRTHATLSHPSSQMLLRTLCANLPLPDERCRRWMVDSSLVELQKVQYLDQI
jgi:hypothetical protein